MSDTKIKWKKLTSISIDWNAYNKLQTYFKWTNLTASSIYDKITRDLIYSFEWVEIDRKTVVIQFNNYEWYWIKDKIDKCLVEIENKSWLLLKFIWLITDSYHNESNYFLDNDWNKLCYIRLDFKSSEINTSMNLFKFHLEQVFEKKFKDTYDLLKKNKLDLLNNKYVSWNNEKEALKELKQYLFIL